MDPTLQPQMSPQDHQANGDQPITPEQKQEMLDLITKIEEQLSHTKAIQFASKAKMESYRNGLLQQVFDGMHAAGIDLNDRQSVSDFINKLREENPDLADMFEKSMDVLLGGDADTSAAGEVGQEMAPPVNGGGGSYSGGELQNNMNIPNDSQQPQQQESRG